MFSITFCFNLIKVQSYATLVPLDGILVVFVIRIIVNSSYTFLTRGIYFFKHQTCLENLFFLRYVGIGSNIHAQSLGAVS